MKVLLPFIILTLFSTVSYTQEEVQELNQTSFHYQYENGSAISIQFEEDSLSYQWIKGPQANKVIKRYPYKVRTLSASTYFVHWQEPDVNNFITLVFDFNKMEVFSSEIVNYGSDSSFTIFEQATISNFKKNNMEILPYASIPDYKTAYNPGNVLCRLIDGLGYRYYWVTEGLRPEDLAYVPSEGAQSVQKTLEHIYGLSDMIRNGAKNSANVRPSDFSGLSFPELRKKTLENLQQASALLEGKSAEELSNLKVIFDFYGKESSYPFWNMINGPISDAIYHTGQIVSFRRTTGNPIHPKVNVFRGKTGK